MTYPLVALLHEDVQKRSGSREGGGREGRYKTTASCGRPSHSVSTFLAIIRCERASEPRKGREKDPQRERGTR